MSAPIPLRRDFDASQLRSLARRTNDGPSGPAGFLALAAIYDGGDAHRGGQDRRHRAFRSSGTGLLRFNARGPDALLNGKSPGQPCKLNELQRRAIADMIESGPIPAVHGVGALAADRSGAMDLFEEFRITIRQADAQSGAARHGLPQTLGPDRATMRKRRARLRILKKLSRAPGGNRARQGARLRHD